eukprot:jgi/Chrzof1/5894/Cz16g19200.t1
MATLNALQCLGLKDALFAAAAVDLVSDLVADEAVCVRLAALECLTAWSKQLSDLLAQARSAGQAEQATAVNLETHTAEHTESEADVNEAKATAVGQGHAAAVPNVVPEDTHWGQEVVSAACFALHDAEPTVRCAARELLQYLPLVNAASLMAVVQAATQNCSRYPSDSPAVLQLMLQLGARQQHLTVKAATGLQRMLLAHVQVPHPNPHQYEPVLNVLVGAATAHKSTLLDSGILTEHTLKLIASQQQQQRW